MNVLEHVLWVSSLVLSGVLVVRLAMSRLYRVYLWFFAFLCFQIAQSLGMLPLDPDNNLYAWAFLFSQPVSWFLYILIVLELYSLALRKHEGIASLSRWVLTAALVVAVGVSILTLSVDLSRPTGPFPVLVYYSVIERGLTSSLVLFLLLITAFLVWSPIAVRRNILLHASVYSVYFLSSALLLFVRNVAGYGLTVTISAILLGVANLCLLLWIFLLSKRGEEKLLVVRKTWSAEDSERLLHQMDALNAILLREHRK